MIPSTASRVPQNTAAHINERIEQQTKRNVAFCAASGAGAIEQRLAELDAEWDIERLLEFNASTLAFTGVVLSAFRGRRWLALPAVVTGFLWQHAVQGWCPPVPIFRRLGVRTAREIDEERYALKTLRGDFKDAGLAHEQSRVDVDEVLQAIRK